MSALPAPRVVSNITFHQLREHLAGPSPQALHLPDLISTWPARDWRLADGLSRLRQALGDGREVEVEMGPRGSGYVDQRYRRVSMSLGLFLDAFILDKIPSSTPTRPVAYLAQADIEALHDMPMLPHFSAGPRGEVWRRTFWIGPAGTWTPFHRDPYIGIYSHLIGTKRFWLLPPSSGAYLDVSAAPPHTNTSTIPVSASNIFSEDISPELLRYRERLRRAFDVDGACEVVLKDGESVLIPEGWWHSAEGLSTGVGVNAWFR